MTYVLFAIVFLIVGPALLVFLVRQKKPRSFYRNLAIAAAILTIAAVIVSRSDPLTLRANGFILFAFWLAWVLTLAVCVQAICIRYPYGGFPRWSTTIGAMATTIPWFGFAAATIMVP